MRGVVQSRDHRRARALVLPQSAHRRLADVARAINAERGTLTYVLPDWTGRAIEVNAVYPARQNLPPRLSLFLDHLAKALAPPPWATPAHAT